MMYGNILAKINSISWT